MYFQGLYPDNAMGAAAPPAACPRPLRALIALASYLICHVVFVGYNAP